MTAAARRTNRRGDATRDTMLEAARKALATGDPGAVSANRIAKEIGVTWGAVKYQFGDIDGFWAAVLQRTAERRAGMLSHRDTGATLGQRVAAIIDLLYDGLTIGDSRAIENLRAALPRDHAELERLYPKTAAELSSWGKSWLQTCQQAFADLDVDGFVSDGPLRQAYAERGQNYDAALASTANPLPISGQDPVCNTAVTDPARAGEIWLDGHDTTQPAATPTCLLKAIREATAHGEKVRAAYVPDAELGTRWFADHAIWVRDGQEFLPFGTPAGAARYQQAHPAAAAVDYQQALAGAV